MGWRLKLGFPAFGRTWPEARSRRGPLLAGQNLFGVEEDMAIVVSEIDADVTGDEGSLMGLMLSEMRWMREGGTTAGTTAVAKASFLSTTSPLHPSSFSLSPPPHSARLQDSFVESPIAHL